MTEKTEEWQHTGTPEAHNGENVSNGNRFLTMTHALHEESERLIELAEECRANAHRLGEREATLAERENAVAEAENGLQQRNEELNHRQRHLDDLASRADEAQRRIIEAADREAALKAMAQSVLEWR